MSLHWTYLTRRFLLQNYRDTFSAIAIGTFVLGKYLKHYSEKSDNDWTMVTF